MKIKKVDDKPMVIHTKQKSKLHVKAVSEAKIKGRNVLTVSRGPQLAVGSNSDRKFAVSKNRRNIAVAKIRESPKSTRGNRERYYGKVSDTAKRRLSSDANTNKQTKQSGEAEHSRYRQYQKSKQDRRDAIKTKSDFFKTVGAIGTKTALDQMEGGQEFYDAYLVMDQMAKPVGSSYNAGKKLYRNQTAKAKEKRMKERKSVNGVKKRKVKPYYLKEVDSAVQWQTTQYSSKKAAQNKPKKTVRKKAIKIAKGARKKTARTAKRASGAGSLSAAIVSREVDRVSMDKKNLKSSTRNRMIQLFLSKLRQEENQDTIGKTLKDMIRLRFALVSKYIIRYVGGFLLGLFTLTAVVALPVIAVIAIIYNSPFAIFFPSISSGETTQKVLSAYVQEFNRDVDEEVANYYGYDRSEKVYLDFEGAGAPDNYYDILAVYMVKYGDGDTATDMTEKAKENLKKVFDDMCSYHITVGTETEEDEDGDTITYTIKYVNVTLKTYRDMISVYGFDEEEQKVFAELMKPEYLALLGYTGGGGDAGENISDEQYEAIVDAISDAIGKSVVEFVLSKVGYPYSQAYRDSGNYYDCSSLAYYAWKNAGVDISYEGATTAASEGKYCYDNNLLVTYDEMQPGDLIFYSYENNGRFMKITHVAIYVGDGKVVEAANERIGVVYRPVQAKSSIVFIGRPR